MPTVEKLPRAETRAPGVGPGGTSRASGTLDRLETGKDTIQVAIESTATHLGSIVSIVVGAVHDVTREAGDWATDLFEIRDAARSARADADSRSESRDSHR
jgi:hypothetical protein